MVPQKMCDEVTRCSAHHDQTEYVSGNSQSSTAESQQTTKGFIEFRWTFINDETPFKTAIGFMHRL